MKEYMEQLEKLDLFKGINREELTVLLEKLNVEKKTYKKGEYIIREGERITEIGILLKGHLFIQSIDYWGNRSIISEIKDNYDYIFIDCPPSLNLLTVNAMCAADSILVPLQCEYFALEGLTLLIDTVDQLAHAVNPKLKIEGILRTMFDNRNRLSSDVSDELKRNFDTLVYETIIPRNVRLAEAPSFGKPAMYYDKSSMGSNW